MGTILKYIFYVALILVIYLVAKGIYDGKITEDTTVAQVGSNIADGTQQLVSDTKKAIDERADKAKAKEAAEKRKLPLTPARKKRPTRLRQQRKRRRTPLLPPRKEHRPPLTLPPPGSSVFRRFGNLPAAPAFPGLFLYPLSARLQKAFAFASKNSFAAMIKTARTTNPPELQMPRCFAPKYRRKKLHDKAHPKTGKISGKLCR